jgi:hypothetical protein
MTIAPRIRKFALLAFALAAVSPAWADGYEHRHVRHYVHYRHHGGFGGWPYGWVYGWPANVYGWAGYPPAVLCYHPGQRALVADRLNWVVSRHRPAFCSMLQSNQGVGDIFAVQYMRHGTAG